MIRGTAMTILAVIALLVGLIVQSHKATIRTREACTADHPNENSSDPGAMGCSGFV
jgi:hypothetical protein